MKYFIIAGEASGDLHGSRLIKALKERDADCEIEFLGGDKMSEAAQKEPVVHYRNMAFMGFIAVIRNASLLMSVVEKARNAVLDFMPDKLILIDYPGFNLRFAGFVKKHLPNTEVVYYISPKLWAWKSYRLKAIKKYVDRMFTIFPFETEWFARRGYKVQYVGNPSVDSVSQYLEQRYDGNKDLAENFKFDSRPIVALLPGSRRQEVTKCLPRMVELASHRPDLHFVVAAALSLPLQLYKDIVGERVTVVADSTYSLLAKAYVAVVNSGTATLETALFRVPQMVVYDVFGGRVALLLKNLLIKTDYISLVNIIAGKEVVKELVASDFSVEKMIPELDSLADNDTYRSKMLADYERIAEMLGPQGAAARCADFIVAER